MTHRLLWKSPRIPAEILDREDFVWKVRETADTLASSDTPSSSDMESIFTRYNSSTAPQRDAIDAAFVWFTGYTLATLAAMAASPEPSEYGRLLAQWRRPDVQRK